jgi:hypothetical protein
MSTIVNYLPHQIEDLDILLVRRNNSYQIYYDFFVSRYRVMASLKYKLEHDSYYKDVQLT